MAASAAHTGDAMFSGDTALPADLVSADTAGPNDSDCDCNAESFNEAVVDPGDSDSILAALFDGILVAVSDDDFNVRSFDPCVSSVAVDEAIKFRSFCCCISCCNCC